MPGPADGEAGDHQVRCPQAGLEALERQISDPEHHPALRIIGIASIADDPEVDVAQDHDDVLADCEIASWSGPPPHEGKPG